MKRKNHRNGKKTYKWHRTKQAEKFTAELMKEMKERDSSYLSFIEEAITFAFLNGYKQASRRYRRLMI